MLILVRGIPGSGKTTFARELCDKNTTLTHLETDMYWENEGIPFNPKYLKEAHEWCQDHARETLRIGMPVVVSNTFTQLWEMKPYLDMVDGDAVVYRMTGDYGSVHGVPQKTIDRMRSRFEDYEGEIYV